MSAPRVGVLALQGDFAAHARAAAALGHAAREVRRCADLGALSHLVLPGGESTALLRLMADEPWLEALRAFHRRGGALLGTCAGAILLARSVDPPQASLGLLDVAIERNAYGPQACSFETQVEAPGFGAPLRAAFIRAPRIRSLGAGVEVWGTLDHTPVLVRQGRVVAATFHPEITGEHRLHERFLRLA